MSLPRGLVAGALGSLCLNVTTYLDIAITGRAPSKLPGEVVERLSERVGVDLGSGRRNMSNDDHETNHRRDALGHILGFLTGVSIGGALAPIAYRLDLSVPQAGLTVGLAAMLIGEGPMVAAGMTEPKDWGIHGWLSGIVPHVVYGLVTAAAYQALMGERSRRPAA